VIAGLSRSCPCAIYCNVYESEDVQLIMSIVFHSCLLVTFNMALRTAAPDKQCVANGDFFSSFNTKISPANRLCRSVIVILLTFCGAVYMVKIHTVLMEMPGSGWYVHARKVLQSTTERREKGQKKAKVCPSQHDYRQGCGARSPRDFGWLDRSQIFFDVGNGTWNLCSGSTDIVSGASELYHYCNGF